jgi:hypothetical protein
MVAVPGLLGLALQQLLLRAFFEFLALGRTEKHELCSWMLNLAGKSAPPGLADGLVEGRGRRC